MFVSYTVRDSNMLPLDFWSCISHSATVYRWRLIMDTIYWPFTSQAWREKLCCFSYPILFSQMISSTKFRCFIDILHFCKCSSILSNNLSFCSGLGLMSSVMFAGRLRSSVFVFFLDLGINASFKCLQWFPYWPGSVWERCLFQINYSKWGH